MSADVIATEHLDEWKIGLALAGALLLAAEWWLRRAGTPRRLRRARDLALGVVALAAAAAWWNFGQLHQGRHLHVWEFFHHFVGAKYFPELGYTRLYDCALIADYEDDFAIRPERRPVRRLATNEVAFATEVLAEPDACKEHFTPARWESFRRDVRWFRTRLPPRRWAKALTDHGMNATPAWLIAGSMLADAGPATAQRIGRLALLDPALLVAMWACVVWAFGWRVAAAAVIFWGTNQPGHFGWVGGAYLRLDWLAASVLGVCLLRRGHPAGAGAALTAATLLRVFPGLLVAALVLRAGADLWRRRSLRPAPEHLRFAAGALLMLAVALPMAARVSGGSGAWLGFYENSRMHLATPLGNFVGWKTALSLDPAQPQHRLRDPSRVDPVEPWYEAQRATFAAREPWFWLGLAAFVALLARAVSRQPRHDDWVAAVLGCGLVVVGAQIGSYYYALLLLYGLLSGRHPGIGALLCGLSAAGWWIYAAAGWRDLAYGWISVACVAFAFGVTALMAWRPADEPARSPG